MIEGEGPFLNLWIFFALDLQRLHFCSCTCHPFAALNRIILESERIVETSILTLGKQVHILILHWGDKFMHITSLVMPEYQWYKCFVFTQIRCSLVDVILMVSNLHLLLGKCRMLSCSKCWMRWKIVWLSWLLCYTEDFILMLISQLLNERRWCVICMYGKWLRDTR